MRSNLHERQRVRASLLDPPRLERVLWQRQHRRLVVGEQLRLGLPLATQATLKVSQAPLTQVRVELTERPERRHRHQEVAATVTDEVLDVALLVAPGDPAEAVREQKMALQPQELPGQRPLVRPHDPADRELRVVVRRLRRHTTEERERLDMPGLERLGALSWIRRHKERVRVGQRHHRQRRLQPHPGDLDGRLAEVELGLAGRLAQRHEHLAADPNLLRDIAANRDLAPGVAVLVAQPLEDPPGRVALLTRRRRIRVERQDPVDHPDKRTKLRPLPRHLPPIPRRLGVRQHLLERPPANPVLTTDLPPRDTLDEHLPSNLTPQLHIGPHPSPVRRGHRSQGNPQEQSHTRTGVRQVLSFSMITTRPTGAVVFDERLHRQQPEFVGVSTAYSPKENPGGRGRFA